MNMGKGILIAQEKEMEIPIGGGSWGGNCSKENWEEILGFEVQGAAVQNSNEIGKFNPNGGFHDSFNHIDNSKNHIPEAESYTPNLSSESAFWDSSWSQLLEMIKAPPEESENGGLEDISVNMKVQDSHSLGESLWTPSDAASSMRLSQNHYMASNHQSSYQRLSQIPHDGQEVPYQFRYNLNSPPPSEAEPESNISNVYQFAPATPEQAKKLDRCLYSAGLEVTEDQNLNQTNTEQKTSASICNEAAERNSPENVNILDSSLSATCTTLKESNESEKGSNTNIDLNKTPPQKPPRRKKHRPKVYVEGKPKGIRKAVKSTNSERKHVVKRKYVRKNGAESKTQAQPDVLKENKDSNFETASKSCRRALNFVSENITKEKSISDQVSQKKVQHELGGYTHLQAHDTKMYGIYSNVSQIQTTPGCQWSNLMTRTEALIKTSPSQIIGQIQTNNAPVPNQAAQVTSSVVRELQKQMLNLTHNTAKEPANPSQSRLKCCYLPEHQLRNSEVYRPDFHKRTAQENLEVRRRQMLQSTTQKLQSNLSDPSQRGYKREYHLTLQHLMSTWSRQRGVLNANEHSSNRNSLNQNYSGSYKKARFENGQYKTTSATQSSTIGEEGPRHLPKNHGYRVLLNHFAQINSGRLVSYFKNNTADNINNGLDSLTRKQHVHSALAEWDTQKHCRISAVHKHPHYATMNRPIMPTPFWMMRSPDVANPELQQTLSTKASACINGQGIEAVQAATYTTMETKVQRDASETKNTSNATVSIRKQNEPHRPQKPLMHHTALQEKQKREVSVEQIICQFELLNLNATNCTMVCYEQNALVAYKGDGTMIPYESFDPIKRRKPRPKVDLDAETNRLWKLLMEREGGQDEQEMGEEKAKWWEQERKVFCGRADSFIAKMRLFQGDRRFSQWKGSVVDSVVGVFLTQNVSDHLSSSAFMSLAAHFPLQSKSKNTTTHYEGPRIFVQEPIAHILSADDSIRWHEQSTSWPTPEKTPSQHQGRQNTSFNERQEVLPEVESWTVEEVLSSQDSTESSTLQATAEAQSFSGSNLNAYCIANAWESTNTASNIHELDDFIMLSDSLRQGPGSPLFHETSGNGHEQLKSIGHPTQSRQLGAEDNLASSISVSYPFNLNNPYMQDPVVPPSSLQIPITSNSELYRIQGAGIFGQQITKPLCSSSPGVNSISDVGSANRTIRGMVKGSNALQQRGQIWPPQMPTAATYYTQHNRHPAGQKDSGLAGFQEYGNEVSNNNHQHGRTMASQSESRSTSHVHRQINTEVPVQHVHNLGGAVDHDTSVSMAANEVQTQNRMPESNPNEQFSFPSGTSSMMISNTLNVRGGKTKTEKKNTFDWDSLRKQVHSNVDKGERRVETLDSLDYEAVRCADVYEISKVIKERGMNNMLAERIKEFLNRLVQDHGSIDLEWLRNVPPDKAKDYLLSIRGLGLKSVECVRLLTLHHLAFPVDTNVGRIAVRLGWVPLQPLPESLQLHLLELYPVLESIQKYLWPRLCKLDQPTLYELHYHLITFGKVFCTKSRPNCNACPMRGECRHFASAFASARLALPGPEEKSIVPSAVLTEANRNPTIAINSIPPHCLENIAPQGTTFHSRQCEPIVEEPATPEQASTEISEIDIEDMLYEDPDEIPTIRLNVEQFNSNLHNFMQENIQLNESSLSKALVAFTPEAASVPRPKLKNVSRLRTEHQVYEIPDTHPLLEGLDKRESDDPSPYLLAIWTPGEIADSIQPPERSCGSQESRKLCSANTCFSCNSIREANLQIVRGTLLIPCRTAMRGSFPLNGTYFQVNEMFADHDSSLNPIDVPRSWIWNLTRRTVYFGTSVTTIFKGMSQDDIKYCFWRGFVCVRGFDRKTRAPRPLMARLHFPASKLVKSKRESK